VHRQPTGKQLAKLPIPDPNNQATWYYPHSRRRRRKAPPGTHWERHLIYPKGSWTESGDFVTSAYWDYVLCYD
jgi:hypothetical protein